MVTEAKRANVIHCGTASHTESHYVAQSGVEWSAKKTSGLVYQADSILLTSCFSVTRAVAFVA